MSSTTPRAFDYDVRRVQLVEMLRLFDDPAAFAPLLSHAPAGRGALDRPLRDEGFGRIPGAVGTNDARAMADVVATLVPRGLPAVLAYVHPAFWSLGRRLATELGAARDKPLVVLEDVWAFHVEPGHGRGWAPHRGIADAHLDRERPEVLNVWVSLSDAEADRACMHAIPLDDDPGYPGDLGRTDAPLAHVRALPTIAGEALVWNANLLHWGGPCARTASGPRIACTYTLATEAFAVAHRFRVLGSDPPDHASRLDAIARMVMTYGATAKIDAETRAWAEARTAFLAVVARKEG